MPAKDYGLFGKPSTATPINTPGLTYNASNYMLQPVVSSGAADDSTPFNNSNLSYSQADVDKLPINSYQQSLVNSPSSYYSPMNDASGYDKYLGNPTAGSRGGRGNVGANEEYRDFMADRNASVNRTPNTSPTTSPTGGGSRAQSTGPAPIPQVLISQDLTQRPQTGNIYAPDLSAYNDSSLFNYTGPGGVDEYTYGQGLRTGGADYSIFGSPADIANPYYEGQFAPKPTGPADGAIGMNPVQLPSDLPQIEVSADVSMPGFVGGGNQVIGGSLPTDLTYQQTIDSMGIFGPDNPPPSTTFPSPGDNTGLTQNMTASDKEYQDMLNQSLMMDNQLMNQLDSSDPRGGEAELNKDAVKIQDFSMANNQAQADMAMGDRAGYQDSERLLARDVAAGMNDGLTELMAKGQALQDRYDAQERIQTKDRVLDQQFDRNQAEYKAPLFDGSALEAAIDLEYPGAKQITDFVDAMDGDTNAYKKILAQDGEISSGRGGIPVEMPIISDGDSENIFQTQDVDADAYQRALDKERYQTQINNPTADFSGYMRNYGDGGGFKESAPVVNQAALDKQRYNTQVNNPTADFSGYMKNYGSGFKEPAPVESLFKIEPSVQREIASRVASGGEAEGNELMLEAIGLGNIFTGSKVSNPEKKKAEAEIVSIFAGGPSRKSVKSEPAVVKSTPRVKVDYNKNKPVAVKKTKPTPRGPQPVKVTRTTGSRGSRGSSSKPKSSSPSRSYSVGQSAYRRGNR